MELFGKIKTTLKLKSLQEERTVYFFNLFVCFFTSIFEKQKKKLPIKLHLT